ncbi:hypothetical protein C5S39_13290 [Candidatus Methanophagaceae archaeon]|nr:hypothetical protein C5S39_13290 [Methanophagales archaeon]
MKVQVEIVDDEGVRTSFEREGEPFSAAFRPSTIKSVVKFLEDQIPLPAAIGPFDIESEDLTIKERLSYFLRYDERAPKEWFTSSMLRQLYEEAYGINVKLSTLSTYLASMHSDSILMRKGSRAGRQYKVVFVTTDTVNSVNIPDTEGNIFENYDRDGNDMEFENPYQLREIVQE